MNPTDLLTAMKRTVEQLAAFNDIAKALTATLEVREVLALVMQKVSELFRPDNWSLILQDEKTGDLYFEIAVGEAADALKQLRLKPGEGIAGQVFESGQLRRVDDVRADPAFATRFDDASAFQTQAILAVPLRARGRSLGVIELVKGPDSQPFTDEDVRALAAMADFAAIAIDNARNFQRVQDLTLTDEHTALYNARCLRQQLEHEVARARRFSHPLSLIFLDLDRFKQVNDTHGHMAGSALLREVGEVLQGQIRGVDSGFRYGGDEFAVLLLETDLLGAQQVAERMRDAFRGRRFLASRGLSLELTASFGVATFPNHAHDASSLVDAADRAMYRVKAAGRNEVAVAPSPIPASSVG